MKICPAWLGKEQAEKETSVDLVNFIIRYFDFPINGFNSLASSNSNGLIKSPIFSSKAIILTVRVNNLLTQCRNCNPPVWSVCGKCTISLRDVKRENLFKTVV